MDVLRAHIDRVEVVGLDEAYLDLAGFERPKAAARRVKAAVEDATGPRLLDRHRPLEARGEGRLRRREAERLRRPHARAGVRAVRPLAARPDPRDRARRRWSGSPSRGSTRSRSSPRRPRTALTAWFGPRLGPHLRPARALRAREPGHDRPGREVGVARDDVRLRPARPRRAHARARAARRRAVRHARPRGAPRPHGRHQGPARRLLDAHARADARRAHERPRRRHRRRARAAARVRPAAARAAARRAGSPAWTAPPMRRAAQATTRWRWPSNG